MILRPEQTSQLRQFVDELVQEHGCDHTLTFTQRWAAENRLSWEELLDILEANGAFCDCEAVLNLDEEEVLSAGPEGATPDKANWFIPTEFKPNPSAIYAKIIVGNSALSERTYTSEHEWLVPAPKGTKPRKHMRKSVHFFIGINSGMPSEVGVVTEMPPVSATEFAKKVRVGGIPDLAAFTEREAAFTLSRLAVLEIGMPVGTHFMEINDFTGKAEELRVHRIIMRGA